MVSKRRRVNIISDPPTWICNSGQKTKVRLCTFDSLPFLNKILHIPDPVLTILLNRKSILQIVGLELVSALVLLHQLLTRVIRVWSLLDSLINAVMSSTSQYNHLYYSRKAKHVKYISYMENVL